MAGESVAAGVSIPLGDTLVMYTVPGDADLSGAVDFNDFLALQSDYNKPGDWAQGDFDYSGTVDFNDFLILQGSYNHSLTSAPGHVMEAALSIPEPALPTIALLMAWSCRRRKHMKRNV
jgi:hypothetical protein